MIVKAAEKFHYLPSASWRIRKASGINQFIAKGLRTRSTNVYEQERMDAPATMMIGSFLAFAFIL
jgi:hypothetical protein